MKQFTIVNCWRHTKILPSTLEADPDVDDDDDDMTLANLQLLQRMPADPRMDARTYIDVDNAVETGETLNVLEI